MASLHSLVERVWYGERTGLPLRALLWPLWLLSQAFGAVVRRRRRGAARRAQRVEGARVLSVGNLAVGGAGKTPVAMLLAQRLLAEGRAPAVLSRGYGRQGSGVLVVSDGRGHHAPVREAGDEPSLIARRCPQVPVLVGADRVALGRLAVERFGARTLVVDDGFQHLKLGRDLDVVVLDATCPFGNGHLMPRGPLREGPDALAAAGVVWLSRVDQAEPERVAALVARVRSFTPAAIVRSAYRVVDVVDEAGRSLGAQALQGRRVLMLAGLARPGSFRATLRGLGAEVGAELVLRDHQWLGEAEFVAARRLLERHGLGAMALTEKDAVRLPEGAGVSCMVVRIEPVILDGAEALDRALEATWAR